MFKNLQERMKTEVQQSPAMASSEDASQRPHGLPFSNKAGLSDTRLPSPQEAGTVPLGCLPNIPRLPLLPLQPGYVPVSNPGGTYVAQLGSSQSNVGQVPYAGGTPIMPMPFASALPGYIAAQPPLSMVPIPSSCPSAVGGSQHVMSEEAHDPASSVISNQDSSSIRGGGGNASNLQKSAPPSGTSVKRSHSAKERSKPLFLFEQQHHQQQQQQSSKEATPQTSPKTQRKEMAVSQAQAQQMLMQSAQFRQALMQSYPPQSAPLDGMMPANMAPTVSPYSGLPVMNPMMYASQMAPPFSQQPAFAQQPFPHQLSYIPQSAYPYQPTQPFVYPAYPPQQQAWAGLNMAPQPLQQPLLHPVAVPPQGGAGVVTSAEQSSVKEASSSTSLNLK